MRKDPRTGRRRQERRSGFRTRADAEAALTELIAQVQSDSYRHDERITVEAFLHDWIEAKSATLRPTTLKDYRRHVDAHLVPRLGHLRLRDLRTSHVSRLLRDVADDDDGPGPTTVRRIHATLRSALGDACRDELVRVNVAKNAVAPRSSRPKVNPWQPEELGAFLDFVAADPLAPVFELMAMAGLRRGEAAGLRWSDGDLVEGLLVVRQQVVQLDGESFNCSSCGQQHRGLLFGPPKTSSGEARRVDLGTTAVGHLLNHRLGQDEHRAQWGSAYADHDLVFAREDGNPLHPERITSSSLGRSRPPGCGTSDCTISAMAEPHCCWPPARTSP